MKIFKLLRLHSARTAMSLLLLVTTVITTTVRSNAQQPGCSTCTTNCCTWTTSGSTGYPDNYNDLSYDHAWIYLDYPAHNVRRTIRYNLPVLSCFTVSNPYRYFKFRYLDTGDSSNVVLRLVEYDPVYGVTNSRVIFDSNNYSWSPNPQTRTVYFPWWNWYCYDKTYFIECEFNKRSYSESVGLSFIQVGTANNYGDYGYDR